MDSVSFTSPGYDYSADLEAIKRRQALAQALQAQSMQGIESPQVGQGQFAVRTSPYQTAAKLVQALAARRQEHKAEQQQRDLSTRAQNEYRTALTTGLQQLQGSPEKTIQPDPQEIAQSADQGTPEVQPKNIPAQAPNPMAALQTLGSNPMTAQFAPMAIQEIQRQRMIEALRGAQTQTAQAPNAAAGNTGPSYGQQGFSPAPVPPPSGGNSMGGPAGGVPLAAWMQGDPQAGYMKYLEQFAKDRLPINVRPGGTVYTPGQGPQFTAPQSGMQTNWGPQGPQAAVVPGAQEAAARGAGMTATATEAARAPFQLSTVNTQGAPTLMTHQQAIEQATGRPMPQPGTITAAGVNVPLAAGGLRLQDQSQSAANTEAGKQFIEEMRQNYAKLRDVPATLANMERGKQLAAGQAAQFMGPLGESRLALTKFFRANVPGMENLKTEGVKSAEELQSTLFNQVMDNLKKMDASPSQYQQQVMQEAFGTLRTDPASVPRIMDVFSDILRNRVQLHNQTVESAEKRGTSFPYDVRVKVPKGGSGQLQLSPATLEFMKRNGIELPQ